MLPTREVPSVLPGISMCLFVLTFPGGIAIGPLALLFPVAGFVTGLYAVVTLRRAWFAWTAFALNSAILTLLVILALGIIG